MIEIDLGSEIVTNDGFSVLIEMAEGHIPSVTITFFKTNSNYPFINSMRDKIVLYYKDKYLFDLIPRTIMYNSNQSLIVVGSGTFPYFYKSMSLVYRKGEKIKDKNIKCDFELRNSIALFGRLVDIISYVGVGRSYYFLEDGIYIDKGKSYKGLEYSFMSLNFSSRRKHLSEFLNEDKFKYIKGYDFKTALNFLIMPGISNSFYDNDNQKEVYYIVDRVVHYLSPHGNGQSKGFIKAGYW